MIRQVSPVIHFENAHTIAVPLRAPSLEQTVITLVVTMTGRSYALRVSDNLAAPRWRLANSDAFGTARWFRVPGPHHGVYEITIETPNQVKITGTAVAAEVAGVSPGQAVQLLADLVDGVAQ